uniref:Uncharacterized protein n=1 Tax=Arundo donax TaxID=35708 RepID=A0A0A9BGW6_ARUDO
MGNYFGTVALQSQAQVGGGIAVVLEEKMKDSVVDDDVFVAQQAAGFVRGRRRDGRGSLRVQQA